MVRYIAPITVIIFLERKVPPMLICWEQGSKMNNLFVSLLYLIISFSATLVIYKRFGKLGLYSWMCLLVVICNIQTIKLSEIFGLTISLGNISYGALFLTTDIIYYFNASIFAIHTV